MHRTAEETRRMVTYTRTAGVGRRGFLNTCIYRITVLDTWLLSLFNSGPLPVRSRLSHARALGFWVCRAVVP